MAQNNPNQNQNQNQNKPKPTPALDAPKFGTPKFDVPNLEVPAAFREIAEKGISQAKDNYEKMKSAAEQATDVLENTYATASKGASDYGTKVIENARANTNAAFDLFGRLLAAKSYSEVVELSTGYLRSQFETVTAQTKDLAAHAQKVATETAEPIKEGFNSAVRKAA
ncbi:MAG: phasin [Pseudolabrys sp.]